ncbi:hypothetical protein JTE88_04690 [Arcanobacterium phocisimile]|uniref:UmuC domain-containing protein n=1 Tax=Arcanobacterium phocisimile TaxID=1302235 RepID=A0ABX7IFU7_9ACTO|nr:hypothetical protein [Arcanobacterium phocisimile]QRV01419.1 hypothetical protein JTE88_04690 [Arcanobacterium phocisimile]
MMYGAVWIPQWDIAVALHEQKDPFTALAVVRNQKVIAVNYAAEQYGVHTGMLSHKAANQPAVAVVAENTSLSKRLSEELCEIVKQYVVHCSLLKPGVVVFPCSASGDFSVLAEQLIGDIATIDFEAHIGFAPGVFAAVAASWQDKISQRTADVIDHLPLERIVQSYFSHEKYQRMQEFVELALLLGHTQLGDLRKIPRRSFVTRFGKTGVEILQLLDGEDPCPPYFRPAESETISRVLDTPISHLDHIAFLGQSLAYEMAEKLIYRNVLADDLLVRIMLSDGQEKEHVWSMGDTDIKGISQRIRWQLSAWLRQLQSADISTDEEDLGISEIVLTAYHLRPSGVAQETLWGEAGEAYRDAHRAIDRVRSLLGDDAVRGGVYVGGRYPRQAYKTQQGGGKIATARQQEWAGQLPRPWPSRILEKPEKIVCICRCGAQCLVSKEGLVVCSARCGTAQFFNVQYQQCFYPVRKVAGPWFHTEGWWNNAHRHYRAWMQCVCDGIAFLIFREENQWWLEGIYE